MDVWVKESDGVTPALGRVWPADPTYFGDFSNPDAQVSHTTIKTQSELMCILK